MSAELWIGREATFFGRCDWRSDAEIQRLRQRKQSCADTQHSKVISIAGEFEGAAANGEGGFQTLDPVVLFRIEIQLLMQQLVKGGAVAAKKPKAAAAAKKTAAAGAQQAAAESEG